MLYVSILLYVGLEEASCGCISNRLHQYYITKHSASLALTVAYLSIVYPAHAPRKLCWGPSHLLVLICCFDSLAGGGRGGVC